MAHDIRPRFPPGGTAASSYGRSGTPSAGPRVEFSFSAVKDPSRVRHLRAEPRGRFTKDPKCTPRPRPSLSPPAGFPPAGPGRFGQVACSAPPPNDSAQRPSRTSSVGRRQLARVSPGRSHQAPRADVPAPSAAVPGAVQTRCRPLSAEAERPSERRCRASSGRFSQSSLNAGPADPAGRPAARRENAAPTKRHTVPLSALNPQRDRESPGCRPSTRRGGPT